MSPDVGAALNLSVGYKTIDKGNEGTPLLCSEVENPICIGQPTEPSQQIMEGDVAMVFSRIMRSWPRYCSLFEEWYI